MSIAQDHGDAASFRVGPLRVHLFNHPDLIREVLAHEHRAFEKGRGLKVIRRAWHSAGARGSQRPRRSSFSRPLPWGRAAGCE
jgi:hypothetical protein